MEDLQYVPPPFPARPLAGDASLDQAAALLGRTRPWVFFLAIVGFATVGLMILVGLGIGLVGLASSKPELAAVMVLYPLIGLLYIPPSIYLLRYARHSKAFSAQPAIETLTQALDAQRAFWKYAGVLTAVSLVLTVGLLLLAVVGGVLAGLAAAKG